MNYRFRPAARVVSVFGGCLFLILVGFSQAQEATPPGERVLTNPMRTLSGGSLGHLTVLGPGRSGRATSAAPERSSNRDNRRIPPGETLVLADIQGAGAIQHIWLTFPVPEPSWLGKEGNPHHGELVLRMYWDGSEKPAVESPVGDFFAAGFGKRASVRSLPVQVEGGDAYNCYWQMPFHKSARITLENQSKKQLNSFYFNIDYVSLDELPPDTPYFCAQYRQEFPCESGRDYLILDAVGRGHYVGTVLSGRSRSPEWFGEGDEKFYIDGEERASIWGTGTEDYVCNAWGMGVGTYPYFGVTILDGEWGMVGWKTTVYRWHIPDPVRFTKSLRLEIENAGWISTDELKEGVHRGFVERNDDYATVAFWYQLGQPKRFAELPPAEERELPNLDIVVEGKDLFAASKAEGCTLQVQKGYPWTGEGQVFVHNDQGKQGAWFEIEFPVERKELRQLTLRATKANDYGIWRILLDGEEVVGRRDFYNEEVDTEDINLGQRQMEPGKHTLRFECLGKNDSSSDSQFGVDSVRLRERWAIPREAPKD